MKNKAISHHFPSKSSFNMKKNPWSSSLLVQPLLNTRIWSTTINHQHLIHRRPWWSHPCSHHNMAHHQPAGPTPGCFKCRNYTYWRPNISGWVNLRGRWTTQLYESHPILSNRCCIWALMCMGFFLLHDTFASHQLTILADIFESHELFRLTSPHNVGYIFLHLANVLYRCFCDDVSSQPAKQDVTTWPFAPAPAARLGERQITG